jgi:hypothetical protein
MFICPVSHLIDHAQEYVMPLYLAPAELHRVWDISSLAIRNFGGVFYSVVDFINHIST